MALSIWLDCDSITGGKNYPKDPDAPKELTNKAFPYFDITLRCYYQLEDKKISEEDFDKIAELQKKGYEPLRSKSFYHGSPKQEFLYKSLSSHHLMVIMSRGKSFQTRSILLRLQFVYCPSVSFSGVFQK